MKKITLIIAILFSISFFPQLSAEPDLDVIEIIEEIPKGFRGQINSKGVIYGDGEFSPEESYFGYVTHNVVVLPNNLRIPVKRVLVGAIDSKRVWIVDSTEEKDKVWLITFFEMNGNRVICIDKRPDETRKESISFFIFY